VGDHAYGATKGTCARGLPSTAGETETGNSQRKERKMGIKFTTGAVAILIICLSLMLLWPTSASAGGLGVAPAIIHIGHAAIGESNRTTLSLKYTGQEECVIQASAEGQIADWVTFHRLEDTETPVTSVTAPPGLWTYLQASFNVPADAPLGTTTGTLSFMAMAPEAESGGTVGLQARAKVTLHVTARHRIGTRTGQVETSQYWFDFTELDASIGKCAVQIGLDVRDAPEGAAIEIAAMKTLPAKVNPGFEVVASETGMSILDVAYVIQVDKSNLATENMGSATITLKVGRSWVEHYGVGNIRVLRLNEGAGQALPTSFVGYEGDLAVFQAVSEDGLSYFGLVAISPVASGIDWTLVGSILGGTVPIAAAIAGTLIYRRKRP